jgi:hypothetical protein
VCSGSRTVERLALRAHCFAEADAVEQSHAAKVKAALKLRSRGVGIRQIAREVGLGVGTVIRLVGNESEARPT